MSVHEHTKKKESLNISVDKISLLVSQYYGLSGKFKRLDGDVDYNFYLQTTDKEYLVKISRPEASEEEWNFQEHIINHLALQNLPFNIPSIIESTTGEKIVTLENQRFLRIQTWVCGNVIGNIKPHNDAFLESWGMITGHLTKALVDFDHPGAHRPYKWDPSRTLESRPLIKYFNTEEEKTTGEYFWSLFEKVALPKLEHLRKGVNYNDAHELNLLVSKIDPQPQIDGVIDFGDALFTHTVNDIAIACAYGCMDKIDPLNAAATMVAAYHNVFPLTKEECEVLMTMIGARLMITVSNAAWGRYNEPNNTYLSVSEKNAWKLLKQLKDIAPVLAACTFKNACGFDTISNLKHYRKWIESNPVVHPIINIDPTKWIAIDLSVGSLTLGNNAEFENLKKFNRLIDRYLEDNNVEVAYGGYGEARPIYTNDLFQNLLDNGPQWRTVHLGLDLWTSSGESILAPLTGIVFSVHENAGELNYGPTVILKHEINADLSFFTLYGHLNNWCLDNLKVGQEIGAGEKIAEIGHAPLNGNWPPHLHFQLMLDMLENTNDFPGVAYPHTKGAWLNICPDPKILLGIEESSDKKKNGDSIKEDRQKNLGRSLSLSYQKPLHIVRGFKQYLYDEMGRRYLDTCNNVAHVGHEHPMVVTAGQKQMGVLNTNSRYLHENITSLAQNLLKHFPPELSVVHFVNSGSEANELAIRMAKTYSAQKDMIAVEVGYHGSTGACVDVSSYKFDGKGGKGAPPHTHIVPIPDSYRGIYQGDETGLKYAGHLKLAIDKIQKEGRNVAGFICESIISCGGQIVLPENYLKTAFQYVRDAGGVNIIDEVQVGFGRVGEHFWAFELQGVIPDIVTMGKPMGNGHPLAAVVTTKEIADAFANGMEYFSTFGGNPVSCAIGIEVLAIIENEELQKNAKTIGDQLIKGLKELQEKHNIIGDVRGHGLFLGFELVRDRKTKEPADLECAYLANRMRELGFLLSTDGPYHNVIKIKPPMCFTQANAELLLDYIDKVLSESFITNKTK